MKPVPDELLFAENNKPTLVVVSANGYLAIHGQLSNFLMDMAALCLGQKHASDSYQNFDGGCRHQLWSVQLVAIVTKRYDLSAARGDPKAALIISIAPPL